MVKLPDGRELFVSQDFYASEHGKFVMSATDAGMFLFVWEAILAVKGHPSATITVRQFDDVPFIRALTDESYVPPAELRLSVDNLNKADVQEFRLLPTAFTRKHCPWFQQPIVVKPRLEDGEQFINYWLTDANASASRVLVRRHVVGISTNGLRMQMVISPSGKITICCSENQSYEGE